MARACLLLCSPLLFGPVVTASAQSPGIQPAPPTPGIVAPRDIEYPGVVQVDVDATDFQRRVFDVHQTIPVFSPGPMTLLYPKWIPGHHSPADNTAHLVAGLTITANGQTVPWVRDEVEMTALHVNVPQGSESLELHFQFLSPTDSKAGLIVMTPVMLNLQWWSTAFYPAGYYVSRIPVQASVKLPDGWGYGCALETDGVSGGRVQFKPTDFETLVDSPMFAGRYFQRVQLTGDGEIPVQMNVVADSDDLLEIGTKSLEAHRELVVQARRLFGGEHYNHYDFLLAASDELGELGLEHHRSSQNSVIPNYFTKWDSEFSWREILPHEFTHSWNGKFRRPAAMWTPTYQEPMRDSLLWVYEGLTQYWGEVLTARSGMLTTTQALESLALQVAYQVETPGNRWRNLQDTTRDPILTYRRPLPWSTYQRAEDYYWEGALIWLDADTLLREKTGSEKSLDDFARAFFGIENGCIGPVTYNFDDVVAAMNAVAPHDWRQFFKSRLESLSPTTLLDGITRGGYRLAFTNSPSEIFTDTEATWKVTDFRHSLGLVVGEDDSLSEVIWDSPAFRAGLTVGSALIAVNGVAYDTDLLKSAIERATRPDADPIELLVKHGKRFRTVKLDYHDGLRYPVLERIPGTPDLLGQILAPRR
ncbi:MAG: M61 family metallopeptidase [Verrucomicrobiales bacterium]|nr:M61 family metallopeptidase [Verrucomicrobiales bacterium]